MALTILLEFTVRPGAADVDHYLRTDLAATVTYPGNESTEVVSDPEQPDKLFILTRWTTPEAYAAYSAWRRTPEGAIHLGEISAGAPTIHRFHTHISF